MQRATTILLCAWALGAAACPAVANGAAAAAGEVEDSGLLWATVNICDTEAHPDVIGIRASMPATRAREVPWMRLRVQYRSPADGQWQPIQEGADSGWQRVAASAARRAESGWNFTFVAPEGGEHLLRGMVSFKWTRDGRTVRRLRELTEAGHGNTRGADPPPFSAATCEIS